LIKAATAALLVLVVSGSHDPETGWAYKTPILIAASAPIFSFLRKCRGVIIFQDTDTNAKSMRPEYTKINELVPRSPSRAIPIDGSTRTTNNKSRDNVDRNVPAHSFGKRVPGLLQSLTINPE